MKAIRAVLARVPEVPTSRDILRAKFRLGSMSLIPGDAHPRWGAWLQEAAFEA